ncbi:MAG: ABC transporter ATP-binding protein [Ktedonobacteraceae bacterium]
MRLPLKRYITLLAAYLRPQWARALLLAVLLCGSIGLQLLNPQILAYFIDTALGGGATLPLVLAGIAFIGIALLNQGISVANTYFSEYVAWTATNQLRTDLVAHCLSLDMGFHKAHTAGELIERIDGDVDLLSNFFSEFVINLLSSALMVVGVLLLFFRIDWHLGLVFTGFCLLTLSLLMLIRRRALPFTLANRQCSADFFGFLGEQLVGTEDVRANGATSWVMRRFYALLRSWLPIYRKYLILGTLLGLTAITMFNIAGALAVGLGAYLLGMRAITIGTVYLLFAYTDMLSQPLRQIMVQLQDLQQAEACIQRIDSLLHTAPAIVDGVGTPLPPGALSVEFRNVSFGYVAGEPVIHDLAFTLQPGKVLGVLGRTGSGKTTLARLLFRLYDPQAGEVRVGDVPVCMARLRDLRGRIAMVTQDVQIFRASLRDNLAFFNRTLSDARLIEVLDDVGLSAWYRALPGGLDTELGSEGQGISAGEAQLLAFARVFLSDPGLVILDEASSRLDPATEQLIERAVSKLFAGRTAIVIAHRLATVQRADEILVLEDGRLLEHGSRESLASAPGSRFAHLLQTGLEEVHA